jgi:hypothetical protein
MTPCARLYAFIDLAQMLIKPPFHVLLVGCADSLMLIIRFQCLNVAMLYLNALVFAFRKILCLLVALMIKVLR